MTVPNTINRITLVEGYDGFGFPGHSKRRRTKRLGGAAAAAKKCKGKKGKSFGACVRRVAKGGPVNPNPSKSRRRHRQ